MRDRKQINRNIRSKILNENTKVKRRILFTSQTTFQGSFKRNCLVHTTRPRPTMYHKSTQNEFFGGKWPEIGSRAITLGPLVRPPHPVNWVHINIGATGALIIIRAPHFSLANINLIHNDIYSISCRFYPCSLSCLLIGNKNKFYNKMTVLDEY